MHPSAEQQQQQLAALKEAVQAKMVAAKQQEAAQLVAGVAAKYGLAADYGKAEQTIKAVWAEQVREGGVTCRTWRHHGWVCSPVHPAGTFRGQTSIVPVQAWLLPPPLHATIHSSHCLQLPHPPHRAAPLVPTLPLPSPPRSRPQLRS